MDRRDQMIQRATIGVHILAEFYGVEPLFLAKAEAVKKIIEETVLKTKVNKLTSHYHQFSPEGVTGFVLLAESHISIHTWPEKDYLALDIFTCGNEGDAEEIYQELLKSFNPRSVNKEVKVRGLEEPQKNK